MKRHLSNALLSVLCLWTACDDSNAVNPDAGSSDVAETDADTDASETRGPLELSANLCEDPANMDVLLASPIFNAIRSDGGFNTEQLERMIAAPSEGPFYMFNLIRFREQAVYADGRETERTGREANALYSPIEFLTAIGARIVFNTDVDEKVDGDDDVVWESIKIQSSRSFTFMTFTKSRNTKTMSTSLSAADKPRSTSTRPPGTRCRPKSVSGPRRASSCKACLPVTIGAGMKSAFFGCPVAQGSRWCSTTKRVARRRIIAPPPLRITTR